MSMRLLNHFDLGLRVYVCVCDREKGGGDSDGTLLLAGLFGCYFVGKRHYNYKHIRYYYRDLIFRLQETQ